MLATQRLAGVALGGESKESITQVTKHATKISVDRRKLLVSFHSFSKLKN